jgi:hypothetical protein
VASPRGGDSECTGDTASIAVLAASALDADREWPPELLLSAVEEALDAEDDAERRFAASPEVIISGACRRRY